MNPLEKKIIFSILRNGGLRDPFEFGPWRPQRMNEKVNPNHVEMINNVPYVPTRLYGRTSDFNGGQHNIDNRSSST